MFGPSMVNWVFSECNCALVVDVDCFWCIARHTKVLEEVLEPDGFLCRLREGCILRFCCRQRNCRLLLRLPGDWGSCKDKDVSGDGLPVLPSRKISIGIALDSLRVPIILRICEMGRRAPLEIAESSFCCLQVCLRWVRAKLRELLNRICNIRPCTEYGVHQGSHNGLIKWLDLEVALC